jgi:tripartite-type tricarboxylate transporter receptor subunit TctC
MNSGRRLRIVLACACAAFVGATHAEDWPAGTTRIVAPFAAGSTPDALARLLADHLQRNLGHPFIVEDRPGAGGMVGTGVVARAAPDGTTIGVSISGPLANDALMMRAMPYDAARDLAPVTRAVDQPCVLVAAPSFGARDVRALREALARSANSANYASFGNGTLSHLVMAQIARRLGARLTQVPYASSPNAVAALLAGDVALGCFAPSAVMPQVRAGTLNALGVAAAQRFALLPDLPTLAEQGLDGIVANAWIGVVAPARTAPVTIARMQMEIAKVLAEPEVTAALRAQYMLPVGNAPSAFAKDLRDERARWEVTIRDERITLD